MLIGHGEQCKLQKLNINTVRMGFTFRGPELTVLLYIIIFANYLHTEILMFNTGLANLVNE